MSKQLVFPFNPVIWPAVPVDHETDSNIGFAVIDTAQRYTVGTRAMSWDGSVLRYGKFGATSTSYQMAVWSNATSADVSYEAIGAASAKGSKTVTISEASLAENQFAGGYILLFHATGDGKVYTILGNTASSGGVVVLSLDQPLGVAVTTSDNYELYASPFADIRQGNSSSTKGFWGIPQALNTSGSYGWVKTWGPTFIAPQSTVGGSGLAAGYFRHDGSIDVRGNISPGTVTDQYAGFRMVGSASGDGPLFMLQVAI